MRVGVAVGGFLLFVFAVLLTSVGLDGADSCANSASTSMLPFGLPGSLPCSYYRPIEYLGAGLLVVGLLIVLYGAVAREEVTELTELDDGGGRRIGPPRHEFGTSPTKAPPASSEPKDGVLPPLPRSGPGSSAPPFEERPCPYCRFPNLPVSSVCVRCGKRLPPLP
jgi:hypothetical protein